MPEFLVARNENSSMHTAELLATNIHEFGITQCENASDLLKAMESGGFPIKAPIDVERIAYELGISIVEDASLEINDVIGEICFEGSVPKIRINPLQNSYIPRRRFTIAHEIGHFCLHLDGNRKGFIDSKKTMSRTESYWDDHEYQANIFAAQLLMPHELLLTTGISIIKDYMKINSSGDKMPVNEFVDGMSRKFNVSNKAMEYRLKNIRLID